MASSPPVTLAPEDKLHILRRLDQFRQWHSLDEKRYCLVCGKIITGHQIQVVGGTRCNGALRLSCPSDRCNSIPMDWVILTDEILAKVEILAAKESEVTRSKLVNHRGTPVRPHETSYTASQLLKFASYFTRHS